MSRPLFPVVLLALLACIISSPLWSADGGYLSELAAEAEKVEEQALTGDEAPDGGAGAADVSSTIDAAASREAFERQLQKRYLGSYGFYERLPERSRQEVFEEYRQGADMEEIRKKIISRLLNR